MPRHSWCQLKDQWVSRPITSILPRGWDRGDPIENVSSVPFQQYNILHCMLKGIAFTGENLITQEHFKTQLGSIGKAIPKTERKKKETLLDIFKEHLQMKKESTPSFSLPQSKSIEVQLLEKLRPLKGTLGLQWATAIRLFATNSSLASVLILLHDEDEILQLVKEILNTQ